MKNLLILICLLIISGCKTKDVTKITSTEKTQTEQVTEKDSATESQKTEQKKEVKKTETKQQTKATETDIEIKGKAESGKPLEFHDIKNGDTLQSFRIVGNADVIYKSRLSNADKTETTTEKRTLENKLQDFTKSIVNEKEIQKKTSEFKETAKEVTTKNGTFGLFTLVTILAVTALIIGAAYVYIKKIKIF